MAHHKPDAPAEFLECMDILLSAAIYKQEVHEHDQRVSAFYDYYDEFTDLSSEDYDAEWNAQFEVLRSLRPEPTYTPDEFDTALWQTAMLGMNLLLDQEALIQTLQEMTEEEQVGKIIRPELDEIKRINER